jgi:predicted transcriptional regulator
MLSEMKKRQRRMGVRNFTVPGLTHRQSQVLAYMLRCWLRGGIPTVREIGAEFDISSPNGVICHVRVLREKGYIHNDHGCGFWLTDKALRLAVGGPER